MRAPRIPTLPPIFWILGILLLVMDGGLVLLYVAWKLTWLQDVAFDLGHDRGASEIFQYAKMLWIGLCAGWVAWRTRQPVYAALSALFLGLLVDDAGLLHERVGVRLAAWLDIPAMGGLAPHDFGEILFVALWVGPLFLLGIVAYYRSASGAKLRARAALGAIGVLAGFGVGVDVLHQVLTSIFDVHGLHSFLTVVEEGGEMVVASVIAACAVAVVLDVAQWGPRPASGDGQAPGVPTSWPPSITNLDPVTNDDASEAR